jgi:hypothetical protein
MWEPRQYDDDGSVRVPFGGLGVIKRSRGCDFHDDDDEVLGISNVYATISNTPVSYKLMTAIGMGMEVDK